MNIPKGERETIITYNEAEPVASIYTMNGVLIRKLESLTASRPGEARRVKTYPDGAQEYEVPKKWVRVNASRILSDKQREAAQEHAKAVNRAKLAHKLQQELC